MFLLVVCGIFALNGLAGASRILCVLPVPSFSHYEAPNDLMLALAERGHQVTVISPYEPKTTHKNYRNLTVTMNTILTDESKPLYNILRMPVSQYVKFVFNFGLQITEAVYKDENVRLLMNSHEKFDAVIMGQFFTDSLHAFCHKYAAPCIVYTPLMSNAFVDTKVANPGPLSYVSDYYLPYSDQMTFFERCFNSLTYLYARFYAQILLYPQHEALIRKYFGIDVTINELAEKTSLVLRNTHVAFSGALPTVPNLVEIGGFHLKPPRGLPGDLQSYLDGATGGVIYFSMGSILKSSQMPEDKLAVLLKVLGRIDRKVLWKYENENLAGLPENVKIVKWAPQIDVLAHPNVKLFISHGGAFSLIESINYGVPVVGIPIFGDQISNMKFSESRGFARSVIFEDLAVDLLLDAINDVLTEPKYSESAKLQSRILQDAPISPMDKAIYHIEYAIRYNGAPHLRVPAIEYPWYQHHLLDVTFFLLFILFMFIAIICKCVNKLCKLVVHEKID